MSNYTPLTDFSTKDALPSGDSNKIIRGSDFDAEFDAINTAIATKADASGATLTGSATAVNLTVSGTLNASGTLQVGGVSVTSTAAELNILDGVTATTAELNILDGVTATTTELNYVDGVTSSIQTQLDAKAPINNATFTGTTTIPTADINGGNVDGTTIGSGTAAPGSFTTLSITGEIIEGVGSYSTTSETIDSSNGTLMSWTLSGNTTITDGLSSGEFVTLLIINTSGYTVTWPTTSWVGGAAPTLGTTGTNIITFFKHGTTLFGVYGGET